MNARCYREAAMITGALNVNLVILNTELITIEISENEEGIIVDTFNSATNNFISTQTFCNDDLLGGTNG